MGCPKKYANHCFKAGAVMKSTIVWAGSPKSLRNTKELLCLTAEAIEETPTPNTEMEGFRGLGFRALGFSVKDFCCCGRAFLNIASMARHVPGPCIHGGSCDLVSKNMGTLSKGSPCTHTWCRLRP